MKSSLIRKEILPFLAIFGLLVLATIIADFLLHQLNLAWVGRWLGMPGTILILASFVYSLRKRKVITFGQPKTFLVVHEILAYIGSLMVLVHAGVHFNALLPWMALVAMLVNIFSGITGRYLLGRSHRFLSEKKKIYAQQGLSNEEIERHLFWEAISFDLMKRWRAVHLPITLFFAVLGIMHILSILLFWKGP